jgi:hypothetical protein
MVQQYRPQLIDAEDDEAYFAIPDPMLAELYDTRTGVTPDVIGQDRLRGCGSRDRG